jgi:hypothetical protein
METSSIETPTDLLRQKKEERAELESQLADLHKQEEARLAKVASKQKADDLPLNVPIESAAEPIKEQSVPDQTEQRSTETKRSLLEKIAVGTKIMYQGKIYEVITLADLEAGRDYYQLTSDDRIYNRTIEQVSGALESGEAVFVPVGTISTNKEAAKPNHLAKLKVGSIVSYEGEQYKLTELPNDSEENRNKYLFRPETPGKPSPKIDEAKLKEMLENGEVRVIFSGQKSEIEAEKERSMYQELKARKAEINSLSEKYNSEPQREQRALLYSQLEDAKKQYEKFEAEFEKIVATNKVLAKLDAEFNTADKSRDKKETEERVDQNVKGLANASLRIEKAKAKISEIQEQFSSLEVQHPIA